MYRCKRNHCRNLTKRNLTQLKVSDYAGKFVCFTIDARAWRFLHSVMMKTFSMPERAKEGRHLTMRPLLSSARHLVLRAWFLCEISVACRVCQCMDRSHHSLSSMLVSAALAKISSLGLHTCPEKGRLHQYCLFFYYD